MMTLLTGVTCTQIQIYAKKSMYKLCFCKLTLNLNVLTGSCYMKESLQLVLQMNCKL